MPENHPGSLLEGSVEPEVKGFRKRDLVPTKNTKYLLPCDDESEISRLDFQHYMLRNFMHGNFNCPLNGALEQGIRVLDVGCGSGRWLLDMADDYPNSQFVGTDIAEIIPEGRNIPPNCTFMRVNTLEGLPFEDNSVDFVFQRYMFLAFSVADWNVALNEFTRVLKPGGWLELVETEVYVHHAPATYKPIYDATIAATKSRGIDVDIARNLRPFLLDRGYENMVCDYVSGPIGWQGRPGQMLRQSTLLFFKALGPMVIPIMGIDAREYDDITAHVLDDFRRCKSYSNANYAYGRKPLRQ